jgi:hypothetical protein
MTPVAPASNADGFELQYPCFRLDGYGRATLSLLTSFLPLTQFFGLCLRRGFLAP